MPPKNQESQINLLFDDLWPPPQDGAKMVFRAAGKDMDALILRELQARFDDNLRWMETADRRVGAPRPAARTYRALIQTWNAAFFRYKGLPADQRVRGTPDLAYVQWYGILHRLQFQQSVRMYATIAQLKEWWLRRHLRAADPARCCCILPCARPGDYLRMNSMDYCWEHRGFALIYGLRHVCNMCTLFALLCLKTTGHDRGHQYNYLRRLSIPVAPPRETDRFHAHVKTYCSDEFNPARQDMVYCVGARDYQYWEELTGQMEWVPENTFVYLDPRTRTVSAWVHAEVLRHDAWVPLRRHEVATLTNILEMSDDVYRDEEGYAVPCAVWGRWTSGYKSYRTGKRKRG